jgi:hypothetical protein
VADGGFSVAQNARPAGSRNVCQPRPRPTSSAPSASSRGDLGVEVVGPVVQVCADRPVRLVEALEQQLEG